MELQLTSQERTAVAAKAKPTRPSFYSATDERYIQITSDFEAFLILTDKSKKDAAVDWIKTAKDLADDTRDRNGILREWLDQETVNAEALMAELDGRLAQYDAWREGFVSDGRFGAVAEVHQMILDLQTPAADTFEKRRVTFYQQVLINRIEEQIQNGNLKPGQLKAQTSWITPLAQY